LFLPTKLEDVGIDYQPVFLKPTNTGDLTNIAYGTTTYGTPIGCLGQAIGHPDYEDDDPCPDDWRVPSTWSVTFIQNFGPTAGIIGTACADANPQLITDSAPTILSAVSVQDESLPVMPPNSQDLSLDDFIDAYFGLIDELYQETVLTSTYQIQFMFRNWPLISGQFAEDPTDEQWGVAITSAQLYSSSCEPPTFAGAVHNAGNIVIDTDIDVHEMFDIYDGSVSFHAFCLHELLHIIGLSHPEGGIVDPIANDGQIPVLSALGADCSGLSNGDYCVQNRSLDDCMREAITCMYDNRNCQDCGNVEISLSEIELKENKLTFNWSQEDPSLNIIGFNIYKKIDNRFQSLNSNIIKPAVGDQPETFSFTATNFTFENDYSFYLEVVYPNTKKMMEFEF
jgi:hypothetical protein